ncbi:hypothetical protein SEA_ABBYDAISY_48 [Arthrobacter phage AbbyDaisy]|nr:hypothetical protein SEA_ABBYDAISY_48 [Arthrobacter phage AbbyDaisy]
MTEGEVRNLLQTLAANNSKETNPLRVAMWSGGMSALQMVLEDDGGDA